MAHHNKNNSERSLCNNDGWYLPILLGIISTYIILFWFVYELNFSNNLVLGHNKNIFFNIVIFSALGGLTMTRSFLKNSYNNPDITAHCSEFLGYVSRVLCAIAVGIVMFFAIKTFGSLLLNVDYKIVSTNPHSLYVLSFVVGYYSEYIIEKLKTIITVKENRT